MTQLTDAEIQELRKKLNGITPLPWEADEEGMFIFARGTRETGYETMVADDDDRFSERRIARMRGFGGGEPQEKNLAAIAALMNAAPALLATIDALTAELSTLRTLLSDESMERLAPIIHRHFVAYTVCAGCGCPGCRSILTMLRKWRDQK